MDGSNQRQHEDGGGKDTSNIVKAVICCIVGVLGLNHVVVAEASLGSNSW